MTGVQTCALPIWVFTTVEDVANTLVFLSKDQGALTGQSLRLTHGWAMM